MRIGLTLPTPGQIPDLNHLLGEFERAEAMGFTSAWMPNIVSYDALTTLALAGRLTKRIELGTFVVPTYPRHPAALAQSALTTQVATNGRLVLGIGLSHRVTIESLLGLDFSHPIRHMREYLTCLNGLLAGEAVSFNGEEYHLGGYQLRIPGATPPPILVAALGEQMLRLAGRLASGTAIWMGGPRYVAEYVAPTLGEAASAAGRPAPRILASLPIFITDRPESVRDATNAAFARYGQLPSYRAVLDKEGAATPFDVSLIGRESAVADRLDALSAAGATDFSAALFTPEGENSERTMEFLATRAKGK